MKIKSFEVFKSIEDPNFTRIRYECSDGKKYGLKYNTENLDINTLYNIFCALKRHIERKYPNFIKETSIYFEEFNEGHVMTLNNVPRKHNE